MALRQDDRALLQLLAERGQSYSDLAGLLGIGEEQVRAKARGALAELGGADPDADVGLTDYLLGQADPIGRADAVRFLQQDEPTRELALTIATKLQAIAPGAELPQIPEPRGRRRTGAAAPTPAAGSTPAAEGSAPGEAPSVAEPSTPQAGRSRLIAGLGAGALILVFAVLAIAGVFSGEDAATGTPTDEEREITSVRLQPVDGSGVAGEVQFGLANETTLYADLNIDGLDPDLGEESVYLMWLMLADGAGYPIPFPIQPNQRGSFQQRIPIDAPIAQVVAGAAQTVQISETRSAPLARAIQQATRGQNPNIVVPFTGSNLSEGEIPLVEDPEQLEELGIDPEAAPEQNGAGGGEEGGDGPDG